MPPKLQATYLAQKYVLKRRLQQLRRRGDTAPQPQDGDDHEETEEQVTVDQINEVVEQANGKNKKKIGKKTESGSDESDDEEAEDSEEEGSLKGEDDANDAPQENKKISWADVSPATTRKTFSELKGKVNPKLLQKLDEMGFKNMTEIQEKTIEPLLEGRDILATAKTGSGKTLGFLIPAIELMLKIKFHRSHGVGVCIISPTRELAMQIYAVLTELLEPFPDLSHRLLIGGNLKKVDDRKLASGIVFVVATPGRLLDHLTTTQYFNTRNLKCLIMDEADRILDVGFELEMQQILRRLPRKRQSMCFSATTSPKVEALVKVALHADPVKVDVQLNRDIATVEGLEQGYVVCPSEKRFLLLFTFLKKNRNQKVMVFFSSCNSVKYHSELLNYIDLPVKCIYGKMKQNVRASTFVQFCNDKTGILLCTDVAARGLDIPAVDWIVQFDPPDEPREYIHRVGRTARGLDGRGKALLILRPEELGFLRYLKEAKVVLNEFEFSWAKVANIQSQLEQLVDKNYYLNMSAKEAYKSYVRAYDAHALKDIFNVQQLNLLALAKSFGFTVPPLVDMAVCRKKVSKLSGKKRPFDKGGEKKMRKKKKVEATGEE